MKENLILFGFPCCGKSSAGEKAAALLQCPFIDTDRELEKKWSKNCHDIVREYGLPFFRNEEKMIIDSLMPQSPSIIALGGGAILSETNYNRLKQLGHLIYLFAPFTAVAERNLARKPFPTYVDPNDPYGSLSRLFESREKRYRELADRIMDTTDLTIDEIARQISYGQ